MPSESPVLPAQTEKPHHYAYLKEFRTQQCPLFLQHKCTQHRPYTCFHWHFMNQRRRRPVRKRDGTFNYSPDVYCTKFDETTGICPEGDECPYLHRTAGDTERRYHLRYYKTCTCVYETDARGHCAKNGPHCAFAHGVHDLRPPVYDVREVQGGEAAIIGSPSSVVDSPLGSSLEKDRIINEDPRWNDTNYVLANYKTEQCKRPPRLCRQGYACPSFHNTRDRRRSPKTLKYRSTPCPNVKHGDDWGDPSQCESGDGCPYCHTRTEQQFHPEIYKSTKCNDMVQNGYCPRGPFCAFAHVEHEMTTQRDVSSSSGDTSLAAFVTNVLPECEEDNFCDPSELNKDKLLQQNENGVFGDYSCGGEILLSRLLQVSKSVDSSFNRSNGNTLSSSMPEPIGKGRTSSFSSSIASECSYSSYQKAPGFEREDSSCSNLGQQLQAIENDSSLDPAEKYKRKQNLLLLNNLNGGGSPLSSSIGSNPTTSSMVPSSMPPIMSPLAPSFYPAGDTVESVIGNALDEDLNIGELSLSSLDREVLKDNDNDTNSVCSSLSTGFPATSYLGATSVPVNIPSNGGYQRNSIGSLSQSPCSSPIGSVPYVPQQVHQQQRQEQQIHEAASAFLSHPNPGKFSAPGFHDTNSMSPRSMNNTYNSNGNISQSPLLSGGAFAMNGFGEMQRLREELGASKTKLHQWEEGMSQARSACEAWKREAEGSSRKAKSADEERHQAVKQRDEAVLQLAKMKQELDILRISNQASHSTYLPNIQRLSDVENLPLNALRQLQAQLSLDLEAVEKVIRQASNQNIKCASGSQDQKNHSIGVLPSNQFVFCEK